jgi:hypothetical protein
MFDEELFTFGMENDQYFDSNGARLLPDRADANGMLLRTDTIRTKLRVLHHPGTAIPRYRWEKKSFWFYTASAQQKLEVEIVSHQMFGAFPRFHAHRIGSNNMQYIESVEFDVAADGNWQPLQDVDQDFAPHTRLIRLNLRLPNQGPPVSFDLCVFARDRELSRNINCDPQVGNSPPNFDG